MHTGDIRPRSAVQAGVGAAGMAGLIVWLAAAWQYRMTGPLAGMTAVVACGVPMLLWSVLIDRVHQRASTGIHWTHRRPWAAVWPLTLTKLAGLWSTWAAIAAFYVLGRWYAQGGYALAMGMLATAMPALLLLSVPYRLWLDRRLIAPRDDCHAFGTWITGGGCDRAAVARHARAWAVKGFFTAFMLSVVPGNWFALLTSDPAAMLADPVRMAGGLIAFMFMVDVVFATVGYLLTMRPLDAHIRSANPYLGGWVAALLCYPPVQVMGRGGPIDHETGGADWAWWLAGSPRQTMAWAVPLVLLTAIYAWATVAFGLRFSNLTNRGIVTGGPYRWTKHPAYLSKNLYWWLASMPWLTLSGRWTDGARNVAMLAVVSAVYYWRARTEERHLAADPDYRAYAAWMERHGAVPRMLAAVGFRGRRWAD